jgi:hypothetical protein
LPLQNKHQSMLSLHAVLTRGWKTILNPEKNCPFRKEYGLKYTCTVLKIQTKWGSDWDEQWQWL